MADNYTVLGREPSLLAGLVAAFLGATRPGATVRVVVGCETDLDLRLVHEESGRWIGISARPLEPLQAAEAILAGASGLLSPDSGVIEFEMALVCVERGLFACLTPAQLQGLALLATVDRGRNEHAFPAAV